MFTLFKVREHPRLKIALPGLPGLVALMVTLPVPVAVGVPLINPDGNPLAS